MDGGLGLAARLPRPHAEPLARLAAGAAGERHRLIPAAGAGRRHRAVQRHRPAAASRAAGSRRLPLRWRVARRAGGPARGLHRRGRRSPARRRLDLAHAAGAALVRHAARQDRPDRRAGPAGRGRARAYRPVLVPPGAAVTGRAVRWSSWSTATTPACHGCAAPAPTPCSRRRATCGYAACRSTPVRWTRRRARRSSTTRARPATKRLPALPPLGGTACTAPACGAAPIRPSGPQRGRADLIIFGGYDALALAPGAARHAARRAVARLTLDTLDTPLLALSAYAVADGLPVALLPSPPEQGRLAAVRGQAMPAVPAPGAGQFAVLTDERALTARALLLPELYASYARQGRAKFVPQEF